MPWTPVTPQGQAKESGGAVVAIDFSPDPQQRYIYVINQNNATVDIYEREGGKKVGSFGRAGSFPANSSRPWHCGGFQRQYLHRRESRPSNPQIQAGPVVGRHFPPVSSPAGRKTVAAREGDPSGARRHAEDSFRASDEARMGSLPLAPCGARPGMTKEIFTGARTRAIASCSFSGSFSISANALFQHLVHGSILTQFQGGLKCAIDC